METIKVKNTITNILQVSLFGHLNNSSNFKPQIVADAIIKRVEFDRPYSETENKKLIDILDSIRDEILVLKKEMEEEYTKTVENEKLLSNFTRGKITAYEEIIEKINNKLK
ncbi:MAG: hypothetical protein ACOC1K_06780 [Nanoarchaeota archaeon]